MHGLSCHLLLLQGTPEAPLEGSQVSMLRLQGLQLPGHRAIPGGHPGPEARGDDHIRDSTGHRSTGGDHPSVSCLLQTSHKQISVSLSLTLTIITLSLSLPSGVPSVVGRCVAPPVPRLQSTRLSVVSQRPEVRPSRCRVTPSTSPTPCTRSSPSSGVSTSSRPLRPSGRNYGSWSRMKRLGRRMESKSEVIVRL